jgi:hypothetical protein
MGQRVPPIALRLLVNRGFRGGSWFDDKFYSSLLLLRGRLLPYAMVDLRIMRRKQSGGNTGRGGPRNTAPSQPPANK